MSWLARSIADGLRLDGDGQEDTEAAEVSNSPDSALRSQTPNYGVPLDDRQLDGTPDSLDGRLSNDEDDTSDDHGEGRGVTEDLSEIRDSFARQLRGVASFLAPQPPPDASKSQFIRRSDSFHSESKYGRAGSDDDVEEHNDELFEYDARDSDQFPELTSVSLSEDYYTRIVQEAVGITEEALAFARNIAHHPETWLDFPIEEEEFDDFDITDAQYNHLLAIEHLAPRLAALRIEFCPVHMSEGYFWLVYFVLLHSRLNKHNADLLSSPQIVQARGMWMQELQKQTKEESSWLGMSSFRSKESADSPQQNFMTHSYEDEHSPSDHVAPSESSVQHTTSEHAIEKHLVNEIEFIDKSVIREDPLPEHWEEEEVEVVVRPSFETPVQDDNDDDDYWLTEDSELIGYSGPSTAVNAEDISFSDLEDDLDSTIPLKCKTACTEENKATKTS